MDIERYDGLHVRITDIFGDVYEGICEYDSVDYCEHEYGIDEDALRFPGLLLRNSIIAEVVSLEDCDGPYGKFSEPFGKLEEIAFEDGPILIDELLFCEEDEHVMRMLNCIEHHFITSGEPLREWNDELIDLLKELPWFTEDIAILEKADHLIAFLSGGAGSTEKKTD